MTRPDDLRRCITLLTEHGVLTEEPPSTSTRSSAARLAPQLHFFDELGPGRELQERLSSATVAVVGLSGAGASVALALGAAGVGTVRCIDPSPVTEADAYLDPFLRLDRVGAGRAATVAAAIVAAAPGVRALADDGPLESEEHLRRAIDGVDYVVSCLDAGQSNLQLKLNRVCLAAGQRWVTCALAGTEITVGPGVHPGRSACYLCYRMRAVACAGSPEDAFAYERYLDRRQRDDSDRRENLVFGAGIAANLLGLEVVRVLTGMAEPTLVGRLLTVRLTDLKIERHAVLRKPWCPACVAPEGTPP